MKGEGGGGERERIKREKKVVYELGSVICVGDEFNLFSHMVVHRPQGLRVEALGTPNN